MQKQISCFLLVCSFLGLLTSCTNDALENLEENASAPAASGFTLYATTEDAQNQTRLGLADDGMTLQWEAGDHLVLVNKETGDSIQMSVDLAEDAEPVSSATFSCEQTVDPGDYWVLYNGDSKTLTFKPYPLYNADELKSRKLLKLYASLTVAENQKMANIVLKNVYAKVRLNVQNVSSSVLYSNAKVYIGMMCSSGISATQKLSSTQNALVKDTDTFQQEFTTYSMGTTLYKVVEATEPLYSLVLPQDLTGKNVYFYVFTDSQKMWELKKTGINLEAGGSYVINLDLEQATEARTAVKSDIESAADLRFARYWYTYTASTDFTLANDLDLQGEDVFPLYRAGSPISFNGNGKTIKNLTIQAPYANGVFLSYETYNLTVENATIEGHNNVSVMGFYPVEDVTTNCHLKGTCSVKGNNYVAGLFVNGDISSSSVEGDVEIEGYDYVAGIVCDEANVEKKLTVGENVKVTGHDYVAGICSYNSNSTYDSYTISNSTSAATVKGNKYVGGILGYNLTCTLMSCGNTGSVTGTSYVGGIGGLSNTKSLYKCYNTGEITGTEDVGGLLGFEGCRYTLTVSLCYNSGNVRGGASGVEIGGIVGKLSYNCSKSMTFNNCYSIGLVEGTSDYTGGLIGYLDNYYPVAISYCYTSSPQASDQFKGFIGKVDTSTSTTSIKYCVTSLAESGLEDYSKLTKTEIYAGVSDISSKLSVLNSGSTAYFSESSTWPTADYYANCPLLVWQTE